MRFLENPPLFISHLLPICEGFMCLPGVKINWSNLSAYPTKALTIPANVAIVKHFKYFGIEVFPCENIIIQKL